MYTAPTTYIHRQKLLLKTMGIVLFIKKLYNNARAELVVKHRTQETTIKINIPDNLILFCQKCIIRNVHRRVVNYSK